MAATAGNDDFEIVHDRLKAIIRDHSDGLVITKDGPAGIAVEVPGLEGKPWGYVAGTRLGKSYVSFYLMPVYVSPEVADSLSPRLKARMQGKACFNFRKVDEALLAELDALVAREIPGYRRTAEAAAASRG
ncbi:MAG: hypothetical protein ACJ761_00060 [Chloroflexota bacterium]